MKRFPIRPRSRFTRHARRAFTLIEIMVVVAIIGMLAAIGLPSIMKALQKEGMRKAISDVTETFKTARSNAIMHNQRVSVMFHPADNSFQSESGAAEHSGLVAGSKLPDGVEFMMLDVNQQDFLTADYARVWFNPNGTSDEVTIVLHDRTDWRKITLEYATGVPKVTDVDR